MFLAIISDAAHSAYNQIIEYVDRLKYFEDLLYSKKFLNTFSMLELNVLFLLIQINMFDGEPVDITVIAEYANLSKNSNNLKLSDGVSESARVAVLAVSGFVVVLPGVVIPHSQERPGIWLSYTA